MSMKMHIGSDKILSMDQSRRLVCCCQTFDALALTTSTNNSLFSAIRRYSFQCSCFTFDYVSDSSKHGGIGVQNDFDKN